MSKVCIICLHEFCVANSKVVISCLLRFANCTMNIILVIRLQWNLNDYVIVVTRRGPHSFVNKLTRIHSSSWHWFVASFSFSLSLGFHESPEIVITLPQMLFRNVHTMHLSKYLDNVILFVEINREKLY